MSTVELDFPTVMTSPFRVAEVIISDAPHMEIDKNNVPDEGLLGLDENGYEVAVCKIGKAFFAFRDTCTHDEWKLSDSYMDDGLVVCSLHGAMFDPKTGLCHRGPACDPLKMYNVVEQGEKLVIELEN